MLVLGTAIGAGAGYLVGGGRGALIGGAVAAAAGTILLALATPSADEHQGRPAVPNPRALSKVKPTALADVRGPWSSGQAKAVQATWSASPWGGAQP
jgi:hypothetical protein